jgi:hypothetical protein
MEQAVPPIGLCPRTARVNDRAIMLHVADIEQFVIGQAVNSPCFVIRLDIIQLSKSAC